MVVRLAMRLAMVTEMVWLEGTLIRVNLVESTLILTRVQLLSASCFGRVSDTASKRTCSSWVLLSCVLRWDSTFGLVFLLSEVVIVD